MKRFVLIVLCVVIIGCAPKSEKIPATPDEQQRKQKVIVYQLMTRLFGNTNNTNKTYGTAVENGVGKFNDINDLALKSLNEIGITHIWYTGILEHAVLTDYRNYGIPLDDADIVKGRAGSPYAIKDYYDVNPDLAVDVKNRMKEFEQLITRTHAHNLKVLIDFVPNHVARSYKSDVKPSGIRDLGEDDDVAVKFKPGNNFYYLPGESFQVPADYVALGPENTFPTKDGKFNESPAKATGNNQFNPNPGINEWFETVKLNYGVDIQDEGKTYFNPIPETWIKMKDILSFWADKGVDGIRCDVAEMVPVEFWNWVIPQVKVRNPEIIFIAEIYNPEQYKNYIEIGKFDFLYEKVLLYDKLRELLGGKGSTKDINTIQARLSSVNSRMFHFMENHDEQRIASRYFVGDPWKALPAVVISATIDQGAMMIYFGQEVGEPAIGDPGFQTIEKEGVTTKMDYWGVPEHQKWMNDGKFDGGLLSEDQIKLRQFYSVLLNIAQKNPAIVSGNYYDLTVENIKAKNFGEDVHAFVRASGAEKLLIVSNLSGRSKLVKVQLTDDIAKQLGLEKGKEYGAFDLLWGESKISIEQLATQIELPPFGVFIFKLAE